MSDPDDCLPRESLVEAVEQLADDPALAHLHPAGSDAEAAYVKGVGDSADRIRGFEPDDDGGDAA